MWNPFKEVDIEYKRKAIFTALVVALTIIMLAVLVKIVPVLQYAWFILLHILKPFILGGVICYLLTPAVKFFNTKLQNMFPKKRWTHTVATLIVLILVLLFIAAVFLLLIYSAARQIVNFDYNSIIELVKAELATIQSFKDIISQFFESQNIVIPSFMKNVSIWVGGFVGGVVSIFTTIIFGVVFAVYFLFDGHNISGYWKRIIKAFVKPKGVAYLKQLVKDADKCFSGYIRGQMTDALLVGILTTIMLTIVDMPYAIVIGALTGVGNLIPYVGPILGYGSVVIINVVNFNPKMLLIGLVILIIIMFIDGNIINPRLLAGNVRVHPLLVVSALIAGGAVGGLMGMIMAVPIAAFLKIQFERIIEKRIRES